MFSIGEFATLGRVSVRMLRHYDAIGVLRPAAVDPSSAYRFYSADQLRRLNRIIALKDLGFTLQQVRSILDEKVDVAELRGMLRLRRAQLEEQLAADATRLTGVEARLRMIETEGHMSTEDVIVKEVAPVRVAELSAVAASYSTADIGPVIQPLYGELVQRLTAASIPMSGPAVAYYEPGDGDSVVVHAGAQVSTGPRDSYDFTIVDLPAVPSAATIIHRGPMDTVEQSIQVLARWIEENGYHTDGAAREVYRDYDPDDTANGVTELQFPVTR
jgi:DNA-binding transcriptional MerR regulator/effector-binding domain-containing protein